MIDGAQIIGGTDGIGSNAAASKFRQQCYFSALGRGQTGSLFALPATSKIKAVAL